jgi:hypothetical protein
MPSIKLSHHGSLVTGKNSTPIAYAIMEGQAGQGRFPSFSLLSSHLHMSMPASASGLGLQAGEARLRAFGRGISMLARSAISIYHNLSFNQCRTGVIVEFLLFVH